MAHDKDYTNVNVKDRRKDKRLASDAEIEVVVIDQFFRPIETVRGATMLNVSGGGIAFTAENMVSAGKTLDILICKGSRGEGKSFQVEVVACEVVDEKKHLVRCRLVGGKVPAELIYGW